MDISGISYTNTSSTSSSMTDAATSGTTLGKEEFLKLFVAQLKAQDPLNPMDSTEFTSQLAQFSSLEQLTNLNDNFTQLLDSQSALQNTMATNLIGKTVQVEGNTATLDGQAVLNYSLQSDAASVTVSIYDGSGNLVRTDVLPAQSAGDQAYTWNGTDQNGNVLAAGTYTFAVSAVDGSGSAITTKTYTTGTVTGVAYENNTTYLSIDGGTSVELGSIHEIQGGA